MNNQDEVREEFKKFLPNAYTDNSDPEYFTFTADYIADWWLSKFATLLASKDVRIKELEDEIEDMILEAKNEHNG